MSKRRQRLIEKVRKISLENSELRKQVEALKGQQWLLVETQLELK